MANMERDEKLFVSGLDYIDEAFGKTKSIHDQRERQLPESLRFLSNAYNELNVTIDPNLQALRCNMRPKGPPSFTPSMLRELVVLHRNIQGLFASLPPGAPAPFQYYVQGSDVPGIFNLGGDLAFLIDRIMVGDREALRRYAYDCVQAVYNASVGFDLPIVSVGLLQGTALGGGLECAVACHFVIAERSVRLGLPEVMFNAFPGMGAYTFLSRRIGAGRAERLMFSGKVYTAEEMYDLGVIDRVVEDGAGEQAVRDYILNERQSHGMRHAMYKVRQRVNPVTLSELRDVTDIWVETMLSLDAGDLRRMEHLHLAQARRRSRGRSAA